VRFLPARLRDAPEQRVYVLVGILAVIALYLVGFVASNTKSVKVSFVLFSTSASLIWVILISLILGVVAGVALTGLVRRRRAAESR
jgi:uncharacterized integral membrane protein